MSKPKKQKTEFDPKELREERIRLIHAHLDEARSAAVQAEILIGCARSYFMALIREES